MKKVLEQIAIITALTIVFTASNALSLFGEMAFNRHLQ